MALDSTVKNLLDKFAETQGALRIAEKPLEASNPMIGTKINEAIAAAQIAAQAYQPGTPANWSGSPTTNAEALNRLAAAVAGLLSAPIP